MRVSIKSIQMQWLSMLAKQQADLARIQEQLGSGKRINSAADDPVGAAQATLFRQGVDRIQSYARNADTAERRLRLEESSLDQVTDILTRAKELAVQAGGASAVAPEARQAIANEVRQLLESMVDAANAQDGEGRYLFAGNKVQTKPFELVNGKLTYAGDQGQRAQRISDDRLVNENDSGTAVFSAIRNGNGVFNVAANPANTGTLSFSSASVLNPTAWLPDVYTIRFLDEDTFEVENSAGIVLTASNNFSPGDVVPLPGAAITFNGEPQTGDEFTVRPSSNQDVFTTLSSMVEMLEAGINTPADRAQFQNGLNSALLDLDRSLDHINEVRSDVGARLRAIDSQRTVNDEVGFQLESALSSVQDLDYAAAIAELQLQMMSLETAQKSFAQTQRTSLFDFI